jgi:hypothetical protein
MSEAATGHSGEISGVLRMAGGELYSARQASNSGVERTLSQYPRDTARVCPWPNVSPQRDACQRIIVELDQARSDPHVYEARRGLVYHRAVTV